MKIKLYEPYEHWYHGGTIWVYSDTHFEDEDCELMSKNWPTPEEQVKIINSKVGKKDTLIILGDVGNVEWVKKLKGYKVLVMGNHDKGASNYIKHFNLIPFENDVRGIGTYRNDKLFDEVYEGPLFINEKILLSHEPIDLPFGINIHGHNHSGSQSTYWVDTHAQINVCSNVRNFEPQRLDKLIEDFKTTDIHRITIDYQTKHSIKNKTE